MYGGFALLPHSLLPRDYNREQIILLGMNIAEIDKFTGIVTHFRILSKFTNFEKKNKNKHVF